MEYMEAYLHRMIEFMNFHPDAYKKPDMPVCHITKGFFHYRNLNMCFVNDVLSRAAEALLQGYLPVIEIPGGDGIENLWSAFFKQPAELLGTDLSGRQDRPEDIYEMAPVWGPGYKANLIPRELQCACSLYRSLFVLNEKTEAYIRAEYEELLEGKKVLGVLSRGTDLGRQHPADHPVQPDIQTLLSDVKREFEEGGYDAIYLASDEEETERVFRKTFPEKILTNKRHYLDGIFEEHKRDDSILQDDNCVYMVDVMDREKIDFYGFGLEYLSSIVLLSKCDGLIAGNTLGSSAALFLNDHRYKYSKIYDLGFYKSRVSVIVICRGKAEDLSNYLENLAMQTYGMHNLEIILINDTTDGSIHSVLLGFEERFPESVLIVNLEPESGLPVSDMNDIGVSYVTGKYVVYADINDTFDEVSLELLVQEAEKRGGDHPERGIFLYRGLRNRSDEYTKLCDQMRGLFDAGHELILFHQGFGETAIFMQVLYKHKEMKGKKICVFSHSSTRTELLRICPEIDEVFEISEDLFSKVRMNAEMVTGCEILDFYALHKMPLDRSTLKTEICDFLDIPKDTPYRTIFLPHMEANWQEYFSAKHLLPHQTVYIVPHAVFLGKVVDDTFWGKLIRKLKEKGYTVIMNMPEETEPGVPFAYFDMLVSLKLAQMCGCVIGARTGFMDLVAAFTDIPLQVIYPDDTHPSWDICKQYTWEEPVYGDYAKKYMESTGLNTLYHRSDIEELVYSNDEETIEKIVSDIVFR